MKRFMEHRIAVSTMLVVLAIALIASMWWISTVGLSAGRAIATACIAIGVIAVLVQLTRISNGNPPR